MRKPAISAAVANVVVTATASSKFDLQAIVRTVPGAAAPERFPAVIYRPPFVLAKPVAGTKSRKTNPCLLVFSSGKMVCPGAKTMEEAKDFVEHFIEVLKKHGIRVDGNVAYKVSNVVASGSLGGFIDLEAAAQKLRGVTFEPEQFPGLIYRMQEPQAVFLLFTSGNFVCPGAPDEKRIHEAAAKMRETLENEGLIAYAD